MGESTDRLTHLNYRRSFEVMGDQRAQLLDTGLELVATQGMGGLTHDAVDASAQVPAGKRISRRRSINRSPMH